MRLLLSSLLVLSLSSCSLLLALAEDSSADVVRSLDLHYTTSIGLLGNTNVSGTIKNNSNRRIGNIRMKALILHNDNTYETQTFSIPESISSYTTNPFSYKVITVSTDKVTIEIKSADFMD
jgi:hypothetical protein